MIENITLEELAEQGVELLPARAALNGFGGGPKWASVYASNSALALNAGSWHSKANAAAFQSIAIMQ